MSAHYQAPASSTFGALALASQSPVNRFASIPRLLPHNQSRPAHVTHWLDSLPLPPLPDSENFQTWATGAILSLLPAITPAFPVTWHGLQPCDIRGLDHALAIESEYGLSGQHQTEKMMIRFGAGRDDIARIIFESLRLFRDADEWPAPFYRDASGAPAVHLPREGIICPVRRGGFMRALLWYQSAFDNQPRWVSGSFKGGAKARPSIHVCNPDYAAETGTVVLVGHTLEAESLALGQMITVVARNGVSPSALVCQLREEWATLRTVILDIEPDFNLMRALRVVGLSVEVGEQ